MELFSPEAIQLYKIFILYTEDKCWQQAWRHNGSGGGGVIRGFTCGLFYWYSANLCKYWWKLKQVFNYINYNMWNIFFPTTQGQILHMCRYVSCFLFKIIKKWLQPKQISLILHMPTSAVVLRFSTLFHNFNVLNKLNELVVNCIGIFNSVL